EGARGFAASRGGWPRPSRTWQPWQVCALKMGPVPRSAPRGVRNRWLPFSNRLLPMKSRFAAGRAKALRSATATDVAPPLARSAGSAGSAVSRPARSQADARSISASAAAPVRSGNRFLMGSQLLAGVLFQVAGLQAEGVDRGLDRGRLGHQRREQRIDDRVVGAPRLDLHVEGHAALGALDDRFGRGNGHIDAAPEFVGDRRMAAGAQQGIDTRAFDGRAVDGPVAAPEAVANAERVQVDVAMGVVGEAGMLVLLRILGERY